MKEVCRDFTVLISVPDDVELKDCEIVIEAKASYLDSDRNSIDIKEEELDIIVDDPYIVPDC